MARVSKRPILEGVSHGLPGYRKGCGCGICRSAKSNQRAQEIKRANQRRIAAATAAATPNRAEPAAAATESAVGSHHSPDPAPVEQRVLGAVEQSVLDDLMELDGVPMHATLRATALALAQEIDERAGPSVAGAARQLVATIAEIRKAANASDNDLAELLSAFSGGPS